MLTVDGLRTLVAAATGGRETDVAGYIATLVKRGVLADNAPLNARALAVVLLSFLSGLPPVEAASEGSRLTEFRLRGTSERRDQAGAAAMMLSDLRETGDARRDPNEHHFRNARRHMGRADPDLSTSPCSLAQHRCRVAGRLLSRC
jgi:hypothetical protein